MSNELDDLSMSGQQKWANMPDAEMNPPSILEELMLDKVDYERRVEIYIACAYRAVTKSYWPSRPDS